MGAITKIMNFSDTVRQSEAGPVPEPGRRGERRKDGRSGGTEAV